MFVYCLERGILVSRHVNLGLGFFGMIRKNFLLVSTTLVMAATTALASDLALASDVIEPRSAETKLAALTGAESTLSHPELLKAQKQATLSTPLSNTDKLLNDAPESDDLEAFVPETAASDAVAMAIEGIVGELYNTGDDVDRKNREAIADFYGERDYQPVWVKDGVLTQEANLLIERLNDAGVDGLDPSDYPVYELDGYEDADSPLDAAPFALVLRPCGDCTILGNTQPPDFWED